MEILIKLLLITEMIKQQVVYQIILTLKKYKMIAIDLSKKQSLDADPRSVKQNNFTANLDIARNTKIFFILKEAKETVLDF